MAEFLVWVQGQTSPVATLPTAWAAADVASKISARHGIDCRVTSNGQVVSGSIVECGPPDREAGR